MFTGLYLHQVTLIHYLICLCACSMLPTSTGWLCCCRQMMQLVIYLFHLQVYLLTEPCSTLSVSRDVVPLSGVELYTPAWVIWFSATLCNWESACKIPVISLIVILWNFCTCSYGCFVCHMIILHIAMLKCNIYRPQMLNKIMDTPENISQASWLYIHLRKSHFLQVCMYIAIACTLA